MATIQKVLVRLFIICATGNFDLLESQNLLTGLQACYPLDGNANNSAQTAITPPSLDGAGQNVLYTTGHTGLANTACHFNGSVNSSVKLPSDVRLKPGKITIAGWFYHDSLPNEQYLIYTKNTCTTDFEAYCLVTIYSPFANHMVFRISKADNVCAYAPSTQVESTTTPAVGIWYHVAFYIDSSVVKLYINGVLEASGAHNQPIVYDNSGKSVFLGVTNELNFNKPFKGRMDNLRFYNRELNAQEITQLYTRDFSCDESGELAPVTTFSVSGKQICRGQAVTFTDQSTNNPTSWSWQIPGAMPASSSSSNPVITFPNPGVYTVSLVASNNQGSGNTAIQTVTVSACLSVPESSGTLANMSVYPNPSTGRFYVDHLGENSLVVTDALGNILPYVKRRVGTFTDELELVAHAEGLFFLKILDRQENYVSTIKIIVTR